MAKKFPVRADIDRAEQDISKLGGADLAGIEIAHISGDEIGRDAEPGRLGTAVVEHRRAQIEPAIAIAATLPFLEVRRRAAGDLEHPAHRNRGKALDRRGKEINLARDVRNRERDVEIFRVAVRLHCSRRLSRTARVLRLV